MTHRLIFACLTSWIVLTVAWTWGQGSKLPQDKPAPKMHAAPMVLPTTSRKNELFLLSAELQILTTQINELDIELNKIKFTLADKDMSRVQALEDKMREMYEDKSARERKQRQDSEDLMAWVRPITVGVGISVILTLCNFLLSYYRHRQTKVQRTIVNDNMEALKAQSSGMSEKITHLETRDVRMVKPEISDLLE